MANFSDTPWNLTAKGERYIQIRIDRNTFIAAVLSIFLHLLLIFAIPKQHWLDMPENPTSEPITIVLNPTEPEKAMVNPTQPLPEVVPIAKPEKPHKPKPAPIPKSKPAVASNEYLPIRPVVPDSQIPPTPNTRPDDNAAPTDMLSYVNRERARRNALENYAAQQNAAAVARDRGQTDEETRSENIRRNLQQGTNGIFTITNMDSRTARFSFRGWTNDYNGKLEYFEVEAAPADLQRAVVRKMIELIRKYYSGDFNWESQRLGRVVILSARQEDNEGLEDFMIQEFFGANSRWGMPG